MSTTVRLPTGISCFSKPTNETTRMAFSSATCIENLPFSSEIVPIVVPFTWMAAPTIGSPLSSVNVPVIGVTATMSEVGESFLSV